MDKDRYIFNFIDYKIVNINFSVTGKTPDKIEITPKVEIRHKKDKNQLRVEVGFSFGDKKSPFIFNVKLAGLFEFDRDISNDDLDQVANVNCAAMLFPFVRETVADITRRSGFPPLLLPPLNFVKLYGEGNKSEDKVDS